MNNFYMKEAEEIIGIKFNEPKLLLTALTHSSYANQHRDEEYNERFEFLGDAILQVCITEYLFLNYKDKSEGELTLKKGLLLAECSEAAGDNTLIYLNEVINALKDITESNIDMVFSYNEKAKDQKTMKIAYLRN